MIFQMNSSLLLCRDLQRVSSSNFDTL